MTTRRAAKRYVDSPELHAYGLFAEEARRLRRALAVPWNPSDDAYQRTVPGRLLPRSKVHRGRFQ